MILRFQWLPIQIQLRPHHLHELFPTHALEAKSLVVLIVACLVFVAAVFVAFHLLYDELFAESFVAFVSTNENFAHKTQLFDLST